MTALDSRKAREQRKPLSRRKRLMCQGSFRAAGTASFVFLFGLSMAETAPTVNSFTPALGKPGTQVVINGSGFSTATEVKFDTAFSDFSAASDNQMVATVPVDATTG